MAKPFLRILMYTCMWNICQNNTLILSRFEMAKHKNFYLYAVKINQTRCRCLFVIWISRLETKKAPSAELYETGVKTSHEKDSHIAIGLQRDSRKLPVIFNSIHLVWLAGECVSERVCKCWKNKCEMHKKELKTSSFSSFRTSEFPDLSFAKSGDTWARATIRLHLELMKFPG